MTNINMVNQALQFTMRCLKRVGNSLMRGKLFSRSQKINVLILAFEIKSELPLFLICTFWYTKRSLCRKPNLMPNCKRKWLTTYIDTLYLHRCLFLKERLSSKPLNYFISLESVLKKVFQILKFIIVLQYIQ